MGRDRWIDRGSDRKKEKSTRTRPTRMPVPNQMTLSQTHSLVDSWQGQWTLILCGAAYGIKWYLKRIISILKATYVERACYHMQNTPKSWGGFMCLRSLDLQQHTHTCFFLSRGIPLQMDYGQSSVE